jgi:hypothetical protein
MEHEEVMAHTKRNGIDGIIILQMKIIEKRLDAEDVLAKILTR